MTIEFSRHALEKALLRNIKMQHIRRTLKNPDELYEDTEHSVTIAIKKINEKSILLAYTKENELVKVITLYYTTKLDRLIRAKTGRGAWKKTK